METFVNMLTEFGVSYGLKIIGAILILIIGRVVGDGIGDTKIPHPWADYDNYPFILHISDIAKIMDISNIMT